MAANSDSWTMIGPRSLGRMCRAMMRGPVSPDSRAALTYSSPRMASVDPRTTRSRVGEPIRPRAIMVARSLPGNTASTISSTMMPGRASTRSPSRVITRSAQPPANPATRPRVTPRPAKTTHGLGHAQQRDPAAGHQPAEHVAAEPVGAEPVRRRRGPTARGPGRVPVRRRGTHGGADQAQPTASTGGQQPGGGRRRASCGRARSRRRPPPAVARSSSQRTRGLSTRRRGRRAGWRSPRAR